MNSPFLVLAMTALLLLFSTYSVSAQTTTDFQIGYQNGQNQANSGAPIGTSCEGQSQDYCNGFLSGYLDVALHHTSTHTIIKKIRPGGGCHHGNCTKPPPPPPPPPGNKTK